MSKYGYDAVIESRGIKGVQQHTNKSNCMLFSTLCYALNIKKNFTIFYIYFGYVAHHKNWTGKFFLLNSPNLKCCEVVSVWFAWKYHPKISYSLSLTDRWWAIFSSQFSKIFIFETLQDTPEICSQQIFNSLF